MGRRRTENTGRPTSGTESRGAGPCVVLPRVGVVGGLDRHGWRSRRRGAHQWAGEVVRGGHDMRGDEAGFVAKLDVRYDTAKGNDKHWMAAPIQDLIDASERFPASRELCRLLVARGAATVIRRRSPRPYTPRSAAGRGIGRPLSSTQARRSTRRASSDAAEYFKTAVVEDPANVLAWCNLAVARHALGRDDAGEAFDDALALAPGNSTRCTIEPCGTRPSGGRGGGRTISRRLREPRCRAIRPRG